MRFPSVAVCTLTALVAGGLTAQASETPSSDGSHQETATNDSRVATSAVTPKVTAPISAPETLAQPTAYSAELNSRHVSQPLPSASAQNASAEVKPEEMAAVPNVETLPSHNTLPEFSTSSTNQLISAKPSNENADPVLEEIEQGTVTSNAEILRSDIAANTSTSDAAGLRTAKPQANTTCIAQRLESEPESNQLAQASTNRCPRPEPIEPLVLPQAIEEFGASPALSIAIPVGYGADRNTLFLNGSYQPTVREDDGSVGAAGIGVGLGNADKSVGVELSYALATNDDFGEGGFNAKVHRRFGRDFSAALGWNGFLNLGRNDFEHSKYGVATKVFRTRESINQVFSRVAVTFGIGDGQFRSNGAVDAGENNINLFGNVAVRIVRPVSLITEWTGQDLALGLSIAPFRKFPLVITPALRDVVGAGDGARFVLCVGTALKF